MYKQNKLVKGGLTGIKSYEGEPIEKKVQRLLKNKEVIKDSAPLIYSERKDGVLAGTNIRTDRFEVALDAKEQVVRAMQARREAKVVKMDDNKDDGNKANDTKGEPSQATDTK